MVGKSLGCVWIVGGRHEIIVLRVKISFLVLVRMDRVGRVGSN